MTALGTPITLPDHLGRPTEFVVGRIDVSPEQLVTYTLIEPRCLVETADA